MNQGYQSDEVNLGDQGTQGDGCDEGDNGDHIGQYGKQVLPFHKQKGQVKIRPANLVNINRSAVCTQYFHNCSVWIQFKYACKCDLDVFSGGLWCSDKPGISNNNSTFLDQENDQLYSVCSMRIIVDQWVLKDQRADKNIMSLIVHNHINSLNVIYEKNVRVKDDRQLRSYIDPTE